MPRPRPGTVALCLPPLLLFAAVLAARTDPDPSERETALVRERAPSVAETSDLAPLLLPQDALDRAAARLHEGDFDGARTWLEAALELSPDDARARYLLGWTLHQQGRYAEAIAQHERATSDPETAKGASFDLACSLARLDRRDEALAALEHAVACGFSSRTLLEADDDLDALRAEPRFVALRQALLEGESRGARTLLDLPGETAGALSGWSLAALPDLDGDGVAEICVGAPFAASEGSACGRVRACSGRTGRELWSRSGSPGARLGHALLSLGDVDGDGFGDVAAGAPGVDDGRGCAYLLSGRDGRVLRELVGDTGGEAFGSALASPGDCDGDGVADLAVGAPSHDTARGRVAIVAGRDGRVLAVLRGDLPGDAFGATLAGVEGAVEGAVEGGVAGGVAGEGLASGSDGGGDAPRLAVGARAAGVDGHGRVDVFGGRPLLREFSLSEPGCDASGSDALHFAHDFDGDGRADLVLGDPTCARDGRDAGRVSVRSGVDGRVLLVLPGHPGAAFGSCARGVADCDGDGVPELLVGSWLDPSAGPRAGRVQLFSGRDGSPLLALAGTSGETFGFSATSLGDVDGDGLPEVAIGSACRGGEAGPATGGVSVISLALGMHAKSGEAR